MNKEIIYSGFSVAEPENLSPDGQLAAAINCVPEDGALCPVQQPSVVFTPRDGGEPVFIHNVQGQKNFICISALDDANMITWENSSHTANGSIVAVENLCKVDALGNVLLIFADEEMHYAIWQNGAYKPLGRHLPECPISFGLQHSYKWSEKAKCPMDKILDKEFVNNLGHGLINKFIADNSTNAGKFIFPFVLRYAYRLFDGSLVMHSAPIHMWCATGATPRIESSNFLKDGSGYDIVARAPVFDLDYAVELMPATLAAIVSIWSDIIMSVDIFISKPCYTYDPNVEYEEDNITPSSELDAGNNPTPMAICMKDGIYSIRSHESLKTGTSPLNGSYESGGASTPRRNKILIHTPSRWLKAKDEMLSAAQFYLLKSITLSELKTERTVIDIPKDYFQSLTSRELMSDDYLSHDEIGPSLSYAYNGRINLADISRKLFCGFRGSNMYGKCDSGKIRQFYVTVNVGTKQFCVESDASECAMPFNYFFYPSTSAVSLVVKERDKNTGAVALYKYKLRAHDFLNGSYCFGDALEPDEQSDVSMPQKIDYDASARETNKIYTSEVNNPFFFPLTGRNTVGAGEIRGICSAAKALSQGQFGQFPLYAFSTDGIWALEVGANGAYTARQPVSRDVCINSSGITQLDNAVLCVTDRGIVLISGSQTQCISDAINARYPFNVLGLPGFDKLHAMLGHDSATDKCLPTLPFIKFLEGCRMIYDYVHQRVIVYSRGVSYAYVFSLKSKLWGISFSNIWSNLNSYPEALAVDCQNNVLSFSEPKNEQVKCLYVTRPLNLDAVNIHKTVECIIQRGFFRKGHVATVLYGSRNLTDWYLVWSSNDHYLRGFSGTSYKYFRIAGVATLNPEESICGASVQYTPHLTNKLR